VVLKRLHSTSLEHAEHCADALQTGMDAGHWLLLASQPATHMLFTQLGLDESMQSEGERHRSPSCGMQTRPVPKAPSLSQNSPDGHGTILSPEPSARMHASSVVQQ
jgi:hypothetical protein